MIPIFTETKKINYEITLIENTIRDIRKNNHIFDYHITDLKELVERIDKKFKYHTKKGVKK